MIPLRPTLSPPFQASKWLTTALLIDADEMKELFESFGPFWIVRTSGIIEAEKEIIKVEEFLEVYKLYLEDLLAGRHLTDSRMRPYFSSILTTTLNALYKMELKQGFLIKVEKPVIQLQMHQFDYLLADHSYRSMVFGDQCISWGLQFSYPQLFQDELLKVHDVKEGEQFPNTGLYKQLQRWVRQNTIPTPFEYNEKRTNVPIRLGRNCLGWINRHPQLLQKGLRVVC